MSYLGTPPQSGFITTAKQRVTSSTNNYVDLDHAISSLADVIVWVNSVKQDSTNLSLTTSTRITLGGTLVSSDIVEIAYLGKAVNTQTPGTATVTNDMLAGSIANSKLANSNISINGSSVSLGGSITGIGESNTPAFHVNRSGGSTQQGSSGAFIVVNFVTEDFDTDNAFDLSNDRFTVPSGKAGKYFIYANIEFYQNMHDGFLRLRKNGSDESISIRQKFQSSSYKFMQQPVQLGVILDLSVGDYLDLRVYGETTNSDYNLFSEKYNYFGGFRVSS